MQTFYATINIIHWVALEINQEDIWIFHQLSTSLSNLVQKYTLGLLTSCELYLVTVIHHVRPLIDFGPPQKSIKSNSLIILIAHDSSSAEGKACQEQTAGLPLQLLSSLAARDYED